MSGLSAQELLERFSRDELRAIATRALLDTEFGRILLRTQLQDEEGVPRTIDGASGVI